METTALDPTRTASTTGLGEVRPKQTDSTNPQADTRTSQGSSGTASGDSVQLSPEAQAELAKLKTRDQGVRAHEAAHLAAAGGLAKGGAAYTYQQGPDGRKYAVGGEVNIDTSAVADNPSATMAKARQIRAAALAPADPSPQDRKVAAQAAQMESQAAAELAKQPQGKTGSSSVQAQSTAAYQANQDSGQPMHNLDLTA